MKKFLVRLAVPLLSLVLIVAVLAYGTLRASLPQLDGEIASDGIAEDVTIERDAAGIPVITASNRADLGRRNLYRL